jgi:hypothetical protein
MTIVAVMTIVAEMPKLTISTTEPPSREFFSFLFSCFLFWYQPDRARGCLRKRTAFPSLWSRSAGFAAVERSAVVNGTQPAMEYLSNVESGT